MTWRRWWRAVAAAVAVALLVSGCGGGEERGPRLVVSAASSLTEALTSCSGDFPDADVRLQFAGSDELAAQIRRGVKPDVFAAANTKLPDELHPEGLLEQAGRLRHQRARARGPGRHGAVRSLGDLRKPGTKLAVGSESVPVGSYTREVLSRLPAAERERDPARTCARASRT